MIIPWNNVHLFQQQSDKLYLCCTFGLFAWTLLSNVSQLGLLLTRKPSEQLSNRHCFLDIVLFKSTTKEHFLALHSSSLLPFSSSPSSCWPKKIKDFKLHFLRALCEHCESEVLPGFTQEAAFHHPTGEATHKTLTKHLRNARTTYSPSGASEERDRPSRNVTLQKWLQLQTSPYCSHTTASLSFQDHLWTASSRNINAASVFQRKKKGIDTYLHLKKKIIYIYLYACTRTYKPLCYKRKGWLSEGVINALQSSFSLVCIISPVILPLVNIPNLYQ